MAASELNEKGKDLKNQMQEKAGQVGEQIKEQTSHLTAQVLTKAKSTLEEQKEKGTGELSGLSHAVRQTSQHLRNQQREGIAHYAERAADQIDRVVQYVDSRDVTELLNETERFARRHPEVFLGGAFMLGLVAGRFLKSSREGQMAGTSFHPEESMTAGSSSSPSR